MEHKPFIFCLIILSCLYVTTIIIYFTTLHLSDLVTLMFKPIPVGLLLVQTILYLRVYAGHRHAILYACVFSLSALGDFFIGLGSQGTYFLIGMTWFFLGRICLLIASLVPPYKTQACTLNFIFKWWHLFGLMLYGLSGYVTYVFIHNLLLNAASLILIISVPFYIVLTCTNVLFLLPINKNISSIMAFIGVILYAISDGLLGYSQFVHPFPGDMYWILSTYWLGMWCLGLSVVRNWSNEQDEKHGIIYDPLN